MKNLVSINQAITDEIEEANMGEPHNSCAEPDEPEASDFLECPRQHGTPDIELKIMNGEPI